MASIREQSRACDRRRGDEVLGHKMSIGANVVGCIVLISLFGLTGAAISTTAALIARNLAMAVFIWRRLHFLPGLLATIRLPLRTDRVAAQREGAQP
jgi:hypothetical protein